MAHIRICTPYYSDYNDSYKLSMLRMSEAKVPWTWEHIACQGVNPALSRTMCINKNISTIARQTLNPAITHYMFVDADIEWYPDNITKLLLRNMDVVCGAYQSRDVLGCWTGGLYAGVEGNPGQ